MGRGILVVMIDTATAVAERRAERRRTIGDGSAPASGRRIPIEVLAKAVERARSELRGSVAEEALPEMALRLARHRMLSGTEAHR
jgi:hypothetical protein